MNTVVFRKTMENARKQRDVELVTTKKKSNYLVSEPNYHTAKFSCESLLAIEIRKTSKTHKLTCFFKNFST